MADRRKVGKHTSLHACSAATTLQQPSALLLQYSISEYRDRLYVEIVKRKKEIRRMLKEKEAARAASKAAKSRSGSSSHHGYHSAYGAVSSQYHQPVVRS